MYDLSREIKDFTSWSEVGGNIFRIAQQLEEKCGKSRTQVERRQFVYSGLLILNDRDGWDHLRQSEETEEQVLWMFTMLAIR